MGLNERPIKDLCSEEDMRKKKIIQIAFLHDRAIIQPNMIIIHSAVGLTKRETNSHGSAITALHNMNIACC